MICWGSFGWENSGASAGWAGRSKKVSCCGSFGTNGLMLVLMKYSRLSMSCAVKPATSFHENTLSLVRDGKDPSHMSRPSSCG